MILTITPAPALDLTLRVDELLLGTSLRVDAPDVRAGGKGLNVARVLSAFGVRATSLAPRGGDAGRRLTRLLEQPGGPVAEWVDVAAPTRGTTALVEAGGRTTMLNERAGALKPEEWARMSARVHELAGRVDAAAICGSWPQDTPEGVLGEWIAALHAHGVPVVADTSGPWLLRAARAGADVLKPNVHELAEALGDGDALDGVRALLRLGARSVLLSHGEDGLSHHTAADPEGIRMRLDTPLSGNPTGAGDAAVAGWLAERAADPGRDLAGLTADPVERRRALALAVATSAAAVLSPVAGELGAPPQSLLPRVVAAP